MVMIGVMAEKLEGEVVPGSTFEISARGWPPNNGEFFSCAAVLLQDADEADSVTQDVFLKAYRALSKRSEDRAIWIIPGKWLTRIAVNTCLDKLRSKSWKLWQRRPAPQDEEVILQMAAGTDPDAERLIVCKADPAKTGHSTGQTLRTPAGGFRSKAL
jgi:predicted RNA polymerase sigma factor